MNSLEKIESLESQWRELQDKALTICMEIAGINHRAGELAGVWNDQEKRALYTDEELAPIDQAIGSFEYKAQLEYSKYAIYANHEQALAAIPISGQAPSEGTRFPGAIKVPSETVQAAHESREEAKKLMGNADDYEAGRAFHEAINEFELQIVLLEEEIRTYESMTRVSLLERFENIENAVSELPDRGEEAPES